MKLKKAADSADSLQCYLLWQFQAQDNFNALCVDRILRFVWFCTLTLAVGVSVGVSGT